MRLTANDWLMCSGVALILLFLDFDSSDFREAGFGFDLWQRRELDGDGLLVCFRWLCLFVL